VINKQYKKAAANEQADAEVSKLIAANSHPESTRSLYNYISKQSKKATENAS
jgi:hypothetical protein